MLRESERKRERETERQRQREICRERYEQDEWHALKTAMDGLIKESTERERARD